MMKKQTNMLRLAVILLAILLVILGVLLVVRGAFGAFRLSFATTKGIFIPIDIIVGSLTPLIAVIMISFSKEKETE